MYCLDSTLGCKQAALIRLPKNYRSLLYIIIHLACLSHVVIQHTKSREICDVVFQLANSACSGDRGFPFPLLW